MKRRDILKYTAYATGAAIGAPLIFSLESCKSDLSEIAKSPPTYFSEEKLRLITSICDTILPKTDSPSASEVGVVNMIDHMVSKVYKEEDKKKYESNLAKLVSYLSKESKEKGFHKLEEKDRKSILQDLLSTTIKAFDDEKNAILDIKQQTISYYLNTEEVATKFMNYLPVPGKYEGCISLDSVGGKAWAI